MKALERLDHDRSTGVRFAHRLKKTGLRWRLRVSLHEEIRAKGTPVRRFFEENFPNVNAVRKDLAARARDAVTTRPLESANYPWTATGSAIDYRIRLAFPQASSYLPRWEDASPLSGFALAIDSKLPRPFPAEIAASCGEPYGPFQSWAGAFFEELRNVLGAAHANDADPEPSSLTPRSKRSWCSSATSSDFTTHSIMVSRRFGHPSTKGSISHPALSPSLTHCHFFVLPT